MATEFNRAVVSFRSSDGSTFYFQNKPMTSFQLTGGGRPDVEIITSNARYAKSGLADPRRLSIGMILDDPDASDLENMLDECGSGTLTITNYNCNIPISPPLVSESAFLMSYTIDAAVDGVLEVSLEFLVDES